MEEQRLKLAQQEFEYKKQHDASEGARKAEKAPTDVQIGAAGYAKRALAADSITNDLLSKGYDPTTIGAGIRGNVPLIGNFVRSDEDKQFGQAKNDFISAVLRKESGAAISKDEYKNEDLKYFPQPGDTPKVIAQKSESRQRAIATLEAQGGTGLEKVTTVPVKGSAAPAVGTTKQPAALPGSVIEYEGVQYQVGPKGELTPLSGNKP